MVAGHVPVCGVIEIDQGHRELHRHLEDMSDLWRQGSASDVLHACLTSVRDVACRHFDEEISLLYTLGISSQKHVDSHNAILRTINLWVQDMAGITDHSRWFALVDSLEQMFFDHEVVEDRAYFRILAQRDAPRLAS